jgi:hypothetical protein
MKTDEYTNHDPLFDGEIDPLFGEVDPLFVDYDPLFDDEADDLDEDYLLCWSSEEPIALEAAA